MPHFAKIDFNGDPNIGLFGFATDSYCLLGASNKKIAKRTKNILQVPEYHCRFLSTDLAGIFSTGNSKGIIVPETIEDEELEHLKKISKTIFGGNRILSIKTTYALGNLILLNDNGIIISPLIKKERKNIEDFFSIPCEVSTIAKLNVVGTLAIATNRGCLSHPHTTKKELELLERVLKVPINIGTVSFGSPFSGAGVIANSNGFLVGESTSGIEMGRIDEALGFI
jgi:translation initiation factor 6